MGDENERQRCEVVGRGWKIFKSRGLEIVVLALSIPWCISKKMTCIKCKSTGTFRNSGQLC